MDAPSTLMDAGWLSPAWMPLDSTEGRARQADDAREVAARALAARMRRQSPGVPPAEKPAETDAAWPASGSSPPIAFPDLTPANPVPAQMPAVGAPAMAAPSGAPGPDEAVPFPPMRPASAPGNPTVTPMDTALPPNATPTMGGPLSLGGAPSAAASAAPAAQPGMLDRIGTALQNNGPLLMALGAGFAGAPSLGTGMQRALTNAAPVAGQNQTINALVAKGMPREMALAAASNPEILKQVIPSLFGPKQLKFAQIGEDMMGNKKFGFVDEVRGTTFDLSGNPLKPGASGGAGNVPVNADGMPMQGQELLAHLEKTDPITAAGVKGILSGDINAGGRNLQKLLPVAALIEPGFSQQTYTTRLATMKDFAPNGATGRNLTAISTGLGHADRLMEAIGKLDNYSILPGVVNPVRNAVRGQLSPDYQANLATYRQDVNAVSGELAKAFRSTGMSEADIQAWRKSFDENSSPKTMRAAATEAIHLLDSRLEAIGASYNRGMNISNKAAPELLSPEGQRVHAKLLGLEAPSAAPAPSSAASGAPSSGWSVQRVQ